MASFNQFIGIGNVGRDPDVKHTASGETVANFSIAMNERWKDKTTGEMKEHTEWMRCSAFGRTAEVVEKFVGKGKLVQVSGSLRTRSWTDKENTERQNTELRVSSLVLLGDRSGGEDPGAAPREERPRAEAPARQAAPKSTGGGSSGFDDFEDDIPF